MADTETMLISRLIKCDTDEVRTFFDQQITPTHLVSRVKELKYLFKFHDKHRKMPSKALFKKTFPSFRHAKAKDPVTAYTDEIRESRCWGKFQEMQEDIQTTLSKTGSAVEALEILNKAASEIQTEVIVSEDIDWIGNNKERKRGYKAKEKSGVHGIPLPWSALDAAFLGLNKSHLVGILARPFVGKTWLLLYIAYHAWKCGFNVLLITKEMSVVEMERRLDAIHNKLPYKKFRKAKLSKKHRKRYLKNKLKATSKAGFIISGTVTGVRSISMLVDQHKPDLVLVDAYYMLSDDRGGRGKPERFYNITEDLKELCRVSNLPFAVTTQQGRGADRKKGGGLDTPQWGDVVGQAFDDLIEITADLDDNNMSDTRDIITLKSREGDAVNFSINFDPQAMDFSELMQSSYLAKDSGDTTVIDTSDIEEVDLKKKFDLQIGKKKKGKKKKKKNE